MLFISKRFDPRIIENRTWNRRSPGRVGGGPGAWVPGWPGSELLWFIWWVIIASIKLAAVIVESSVLADWLLGFDWFLWWNHAVIIHLNFTLSRLTNSHLFWGESLFGLGILSLGNPPTIMRDVSLSLSLSLSLSRSLSSLSDEALCWASLKDQTHVFPIVLNASRKKKLEIKLTWKQPVVADVSVSHNRGDSVAAAQF